MPLRAMLRATPQGVWRARFRRCLDDLQFLVGRPDELRRLGDWFEQIHHRREWVEEREQHERDRDAS